MCVPPPDYQEELEGDDKRSPEAPSLTHPRGKADCSLLSAGSSLVLRGPPQPQAPHCIRTQDALYARPLLPQSLSCVRGLTPVRVGFPYIRTYLCTYVTMYLWRYVLNLVTVSR